MSWLKKLCHRLGVKKQENDQSIIINTGNVIKNVVVQKGDVFIDGSRIESYKKNSNVFILIQGSVEGTVKIEGTAVIEGDVNGNAEAGLTLDCKNVMGDAKAKMGINCNDIQGNANAGMDINANWICGNADSSMSVIAKTIKGKEKAGFSFN